MLAHFARSTLHDKFKLLVLHRIAFKFWKPVLVSNCIVSLKRSLTCRQRDPRLVLNSDLDRNQRMHNKVPELNRLKRLETARSRCVQSHHLLPIRELFPWAQNLDEEGFLLNVGLQDGLVVGSWVVCGPPQQFELLLSETLFKLNIEIVVVQEHKIVEVQLALWRKV